MARYAAGDDFAFEPLCALLAPRVRAFFARSFSDARLVESLVETTFQRVRDARASFSVARRAKAWVFALASAVRRVELQRRYGLPPGAGDADLVKAEQSGAGEPCPDALVAGHVSDTDAARTAVARLPESQRIIVHLFGCEGLTFDEISEALGTTSQVVRERACAAYQRLQVELQTYLRGGGAAATK